MSDKVVLVSKSPRRKELLEAAGYQVMVQPSHADEVWPGGSLAEAVVTLAQQKLDAMGGQLDARLPAVAADTLVYDGEPLGKPVDDADAVRMLSRLAGREHQVATGFVVQRGDRRVAQAVLTRVRFRALTAAEIVRYVQSGEPRDKAGSYGIQGLGGALVEWLEGSYTNVVGLPLAEVLAALRGL